MRLVDIARALLLLMLLVTGVASAKDLSKYPCNVFSSDMCFRLPGGTRVDYSVPADFDLYEVSKESQLVATIYIGDAPQMVKGVVAMSVSELEGANIAIYKTHGANNGELNIYITPKNKGASVIHIFAELTSSSNGELNELLSSMRPCRPIKSGGQACPLSVVWSKDMTKALSPDLIGGSGEPAGLESH